MVLRVCQNCGRRIKGRFDKKYCNSRCRNIFHNQSKSKTGGYVRKVNQILRRNRSILETLLPSGNKTKRTTKNDLLNQGYHFSFLTHIYTTKQGKTYRYCYDYGYLSLEDDDVLIVRMLEN